jgi:iron complex outermembrane receptor protein
MSEGKFVAPQNGLTQKSKSIWETGKMKKLNKKLMGQPSQRALFRMSPIAAACSALLLAGAAHAQEAEPVQKVVISGIRGSIESSMAAKKNSEAIIEVITAEDIGKLPDVSIAESLARLPGLAGQRVQGRAQVVAIRGMSPDFAGSLLNGREQVSSGDNRGVEFDQFPSELIGSAVVYKTPDAALVGQGLSGTIDLRAIRPLDLRERKIALNARVEDNSLGAVNANTKSRGSRISASYVDQFANNTVGVALGYARLDSPGQEERTHAWYYGQNDGNCASKIAEGCSPLTGLPPDATYLGGFEVNASSRANVRDGLMAVLEYKPSRDFRTSLDLYYSKFTKDETVRSLMGNPFGDGWNGNKGSTYSDVSLSPMGSGQLATSATFNTFAPLQTRNDSNMREDRLRSIGWNTKAKLSDKWSGIADLSYSSATRSENVIETYGGVEPGIDVLKVKIPAGGPGLINIVPSLNYADAATYKLMDHGGWGHAGLWKRPKMSDEMKSLRLEAKRNFEGFFSNVTAGLNYANREKRREMNEYFTDLKNGSAHVLVPKAFIQAPTSLAFAGIPGVLAMDVRGAIASGSLYDIIQTSQDQIVERNYEIFEKVTAAYVKLGIETELGKVPVHGNLGLQFVHTQQSSHGYSALGSTVSDTTRGDSYNTALPSLNLNFDLPDDTILRLGVAKTLARARMDDMRAGNSVNIDKTSVLHEWSGGGGNPNLRPWLANSFDLSAEKYFGKRSYIAGAFFYKKLLNYIYNQRVEYDFSGIPNPTPFTPASNIGFFSTPVNGQGGIVRGIELSGALDAGQLTPLLDGFGVQASASLTRSNIHPDGPDSPTTLPGLSGTVAGLTFYYEKAGFSARVSERYRSAFRGEINGLGNRRGYSEINADKQTDLQIGYEFNEGSFKGMSVLLQVNNVTDSPYTTTSGKVNGVRAPEAYNKYGRQYLLGVNYKF